MKILLRVCAGLVVAGLSWTPVLAGGIAPTADTWSVNRTTLRYGGLYYSFVLYNMTTPQSVRLTFASPTATWTASASAPWITVSQASGTGSATIGIGVRHDNSLGTFEDPARNTVTGSVVV